MIKASILALALFAGSATAADNTQANASLQSKLMNRGTVVSDTATVGLGLRFDDVVLDGAFVRANFDSVSGLTPFNDSISFRSDLGVGYGSTLLGNKWEVSANRVMNPVIYADDYTEARARVSRGMLFVEAAQGLTSGVNNDTYLAVGAEQTLLPGLAVGALASAIRYDGSNASAMNFNNVEVFARYNVWRNLDAKLNYSYGGNDRMGNKMQNQVWGGINYRF